MTVKILTIVAFLILSTSAIAQDSLLSCFKDQRKIYIIHEPYLGKVFSYSENIGGYYTINIDSLTKSSKLFNLNSFTITGKKLDNAFVITEINGIKIKPRAFKNYFIISDSIKSISLIIQYPGFKTFLASDLEINPKYNLTINAYLEHISQKPNSYPESYGSDFYETMNEKEFSNSYTLDTTPNYLNGDYAIISGIVKKSDSKGPVAIIIEDELKILSDSTGYFKMLVKYNHINKCKTKIEIGANEFNVISLDSLTINKSDSLFINGMLEKPIK